MSSLSREFLTERDSRIYALRATGMTVTDIAKQLDISPATVNKAVTRHIRKLNEGQPFNVVEVIIMDLERLDKLQSAIWPMTQHRRIKVQNDDGTEHEITVEPDLRATEQVLKIMAQRAKTLGYDIHRTMDVGASEPIDVKSTLKGAVDEEVAGNNMSLEDETKAMLELAAQVGLIEEAAAKAILEGDDTVEAEIVEDEV